MFWKPLQQSLVSTLLRMQSFTNKDQNHDKYYFNETDAFYSNPGFYLLRIAYSVVSNNNAYIRTPLPYLTWWARKICNVAKLPTQWPNGHNRKSLSSGGWVLMCLNKTNLIVRKLNRIWWYILALSIRCKIVHGI